MIPLPVIPFTTEEITGCTKEAAKGTNTAPRNLPFCLFYFMLYCCNNTVNKYT